MALQLTASFTETNDQLANTPAPSSSRYSGAPSIYSERQPSADEDLSNSVDNIELVDQDEEDDEVRCLGVQPVSEAARNRLSLNGARLDDEQRDTRQSEDNQTAEDKLNCLALRNHIRKEIMAIPLPRNFADFSNLRQAFNSLVDNNLCRNKFEVLENSAGKNNSVVDRGSAELPDMENSLKVRNRSVLDQLLNDHQVALEMYSEEYRKLNTEVNFLRNKLWEFSQRPQSDETSATNRAEKSCELAKDHIIKSLSRQLKGCQDRIFVLEGQSIGAEKSMKYVETGHAEPSKSRLNAEIKRLRSRNMEHMQSQRKKTRELDELRNSFHSTNYINSEKIRQLEVQLYQLNMQLRCGQQLGGLQYFNERAEMQQHFAASSETISRLQFQLEDANRRAEGLAQLNSLAVESISSSKTDVDSKELEASIYLEKWQLTVAQKHELEQKLQDNDKMVSTLNRELCVSRRGADIWRKQADTIEKSNLKLRSYNDALEHELSQIQKRAAKKTLDKLKEALNPAAPSPNADQNQEEISLESTSNVKAPKRKYTKKRLQNQQLPYLSNERLRCLLETLAPRDNEFAPHQAGPNYAKKVTITDDDAMSMPAQENGFSNDQPSTSSAPLQGAAIDPDIIQMDVDELLKKTHLTPIEVIILQASLQYKTEAEVRITNELAIATNELAEQKQMAASATSEAAENLRQFERKRKEFDKLAEDLEAAQRKLKAQTVAREYAATAPLRAELRIKAEMVLKLTQQLEVLRQQFKDQSKMADTSCDDSKQYKEKELALEQMKSTLDAMTKKFEDVEQQLKAQLDENAQNLKKLQDSVDSESILNQEVERLRQELTQNEINVADQMMKESKASEMAQQQLILELSDAKKQLYDMQLELTQRTDQNALLLQDKVDTESRLNQAVERFREEKTQLVISVAERIHQFNMELRTVKKELNDKQVELTHQSDQYTQLRTDNAVLTTQLSQQSREISLADGMREQLIGERDSAMKWAEKKEELRKATEEAQNKTFAELKDSKMQIFKDGEEIGRMNVLLQKSNHTIKWLASQLAQQSSVAAPEARKMNLIVESLKQSNEIRRLGAALALTEAQLQMALESSGSRDGCRTPAMRDGLPSAPLSLQPSPSFCPSLLSPQPNQQSLNAISQQPQLLIPAALSALQNQRNMFMPQHQQHRLQSSVTQPSNFVRNGSQMLPQLFQQQMQPQPLFQLPHPTHHQITPPTDDLHQTTFQQTWIPPHGYMPPTPAPPVRRRDPNQPLNLCVPPTKRARKPQE